MKFKSYGRTDIGKLRDHNEDAFLIADDLCLYVVADGMGGHAGGDYASKEAIRVLKDELTKIHKGAGANGCVGENIQFYLREAFHIANQKIFAKSLEDQSLRGMGTTMTAIQFDERFAHIAHVGDSRAYFVRDGNIKQLTEDHSWVQEQVNLGILTVEEARVHPLKNIITRSLGHDQELVVDLLKEEYKKGDRYILCSDGLSNLVLDSEIAKYTTEHPIEEAVNLMIELANRRGGFDNITLVMVQVLE